MDSTDNKKEKANTKSHDVLHPVSRKPRANKSTRNRKSDKTKMSKRSSPFKSGKYNTGGAGEKTSNFSRTSFSRVLFSPKRSPGHHQRDENNDSTTTSSSNESPKKVLKIMNPPKSEDMATNPRTLSKDVRPSYSSTLRGVGVEKSNGRSSGDGSRPRHRRCYTNSKRTDAGAKTKKQLKKVRSERKDQHVDGGVEDLKWMESSSEDDGKVEGSKLPNEKSRKKPLKKNISVVSSKRSLNSSSCDSNLKNSSPIKILSSAKIITDKIDLDSKHDESSLPRISNYFCEGNNSMMNLEGSNINGVKILLRGDLLGALNCLFPQLNLVPSTIDPRKPILDTSFSYFSDSYRPTKQFNRELAENKTEQQLKLNRKAPTSVVANKKSSSSDTKTNLDQSKKFNSEKGKAKSSKVEEFEKDHPEPEKFPTTPIENEKTSKISSDKLENSARIHPSTYSSVVRKSLQKDAKSKPKLGATLLEHKITAPVDETESEKIPNQKQHSTNNSPIHKSTEPVHYDDDEVEKKIVAMIDKLLDEPDELDKSLNALKRTKSKQQITASQQNANLFQSSKHMNRIIPNSLETPNNPNSNNYSRPDNTGVYRNSPEYNPYFQTLYQQNPNSKDARIMRSNYPYPYLMSGQVSYSNQRNATTNTNSIGNNNAGPTTSTLSSNFIQFGMSNYYQNMSAPQMNYSNESLKINHALASRSLYNQYSSAACGTSYCGYPPISSQQQNSSLPASGSYGKPNASSPGQGSPLYPYVSTTALSYWEGRSSLGSVISVTDLERQALEQYTNSDESLNTRIDLLEKEAEEQYDK